MKGEVIYMLLRSSLQFPESRYLREEIKIQRWRRYPKLAGDIYLWTKIDMV